jgi:hypothetical protein
VTLATANRTQPDAKKLKHSPIILPGDNNANIRIPHCTPQEHKTLSALSHMVGGAGVMALADIVWEVTKDNGTTFNAGAGASVAKTSSFILNSIDSYQKELKIYEDLRNHGGVKTTLKRQEPKLRKAFKHMNETLDRKGQHFLHKHVAKTREVKNLNGRIVRESIPITSHAYVGKLANLAKIGKVAGPGMILLDGFLRYDKVSDMHKANNPQWQRPH